VPRNSIANSTGPLGAVEDPNRQRYLLGKLLRLTASYWQRCLGLVLLQTGLLALSLASLGGVGLAIDYLRSQLDPAAPAAPFPFGWSPPPF
jgi:hypothetical protein